ncbi:unnamed protein product [Psylliodes chrysocephalus]|uniref:Uncharacterized protein n=1 Tax=Psylliodes chrysocephalus TaxID=3402493 RepID=A0A9P0CW14_9CUCU|nr:unnamed protein product [Psylliodes chrysocephala]
MHNNRMNSYDEIKYPMIQHLPSIAKDLLLDIFKDTDSLIYELYQDPYEVIRRDCHQHFDTSDYPAKNIYEIPQDNKKVLGMMKDENNGVPMTDYIGLRSKLYSTKVLVTDYDIMKKRLELEEKEYDEDEIDIILKNVGVTKKAKGVKGSVVKTIITFDDYMNCRRLFHKI